MRSNNEQSAFVPKWRRLWIVSGVIFAILIAIPATGWLVEQQLASALIPTIASPLGEQFDNSPPPATPPSSSADSMTQLGGVLKSGTFDQLTPQFQVLSSRFPDQAVFDAEIIRSLLVGKVAINRPDGNLLAGKTPNTQSDDARQLSPSDLAAFDTACVHGETLEPNNAYFPAMRTVGLFASNHDDEAIASLEKASSDTDWHDYIAEEYRARILADKSNFLQRGAVHDLLIRAAILWPELGPLREMSRVATYRAVLDEQNGQTDRGLAIRMALMKVGALMRVGSSPIIGSAVGRAIESTAGARAGGVPASSDSKNYTQMEEIQAQAFIGYLNRIGKPQDAAWATSEYANCAEAKSISAAGRATLDPERPLLPLLLWANLAQALLCTILWLTIAGMILLYQASREKEMRLRAYAVAPLLIFELFAIGHSSVLGVNSISTAVILTLISATPLNVVIPVAFMILCMIASLSLAIFWSVKLSRGDERTSHLARQVPVLALALVIAYGFATGVTAVVNSKASANIDQETHGEGVYYASQIGRPWPGIAPMPTEP